MNPERVTQLKNKCLDLLLLGIVLISVSGLVYNLFHS
jgi:hypothetical protein